jgi:hypothetical protein
VGFRWRRGGVRRLHPALRYSTAPRGWALIGCGCPNRQGLVMPDPPQKGPVTSPFAAPFRVLARHPVADLLIHAERRMLGLLIGEHLGSANPRS